MVIWHFTALFSQLSKEDLNFNFSFVCACASVYQFVHVSAVPMAARRGRCIPGYLSCYCYPIV